MSKFASPGAQISALERESGYLHIADGHHKADDRQQLIEMGVTDRHDQSKAMGIYERATLIKYNNIYKQYLRYERSEERPMDLRSVTAAKVDAWLTSKWEAGCSPSTMRGYCEAMSKLEGMLEAVADNNGQAWQHTDSMDSVLAGHRAEANNATPPMTEHQPRAFLNPQAVVAAIIDPRAHLAAELQLVTGLRVHDVTYVRVNADASLDINSKAGYRNPHFSIPSCLAAELREYGRGNMMPDGSTTYNLISYKQYSKALQAAAESCGERYTGTHALRHNYAQSSYVEHQSDGMTDLQARSAVAEELFHHRVCVTYNYIPAGFGA